jgi:hypothetical protein
LPDTAVRHARNKFDGFGAHIEISLS